MYKDSGYYLQYYWYYHSTNIVVSKIIFIVHRKKAIIINNVNNITQVGVESWMLLICLHSLSFSFPCWLLLLSLYILFHKSHLHHIPQLLSFFTLHLIALVMFILILRWLNHPNTNLYSSCYFVPHFSISISLSLFTIDCWI